MKMIIAIIRDDFCDILQESLSESGFRYTKLASTGGFLRKGNTTLLIGLEDSEVELATQVINDTCKARAELVNANPIMITPGVMVPPIEAVAGGATVFVLDVEGYHRF
jgi:Uncharacterized protein conserved in bacteria